MFNISEVSQLNAIELLEYARKNRITDVTCVGNEETVIHFDRDGFASINKTFSDNETFTLEIDKEVNLHTYLENLLTVTSNGLGKIESKLFYNKRLKDILELDGLSEVHYIATNGRSKLIWNEKFGVIES